MHNTVRRYLEMRRFEREGLVKNVQETRELKSQSVKWFGEEKGYL
jgi:hypothetical protein